MAYKLEGGEAVEAGLRRIAAEELQSAAARLVEARAADRPVAIHEARKTVKKVRAIIRIARNEMGPEFEVENRRLGGAGRGLSDLRDAAVLIETFDWLREKFKGDLKRRRLSRIRRGLVARSKRAAQAAIVRPRLKRVAATLRAAARRSPKWHTPAGGIFALAPALDRAYVRARKAFRRAARSGRTEDYHEWRKRAKDQWYQVRLVEASWSNHAAEYEKSLRDLQNWLGDEHNLAVLGDVLSARPSAYGTPEEVQLCLGLIARARKELRAKALAYGGRLYTDKSRQPL